MGGLEGLWILTKIELMDFSEWFLVTADLM
jgi:hypothetical protein